MKCLRSKKRLKSPVTTTTGKGERFVSLVSMIKQCIYAKETGEGGRFVSLVSDNQHREPSGLCSCQYLLQCLCRLFSVV